MKKDIYNYALCLHFDDKLEKLSSLAITEEWDYHYATSNYPKPILSNYIHHTFNKISSDSEILENGDKSIFNTGLVTEHFEDIYGVFRENDRKGEENQSDWFFLGFFKKSHPLLRVFSSLPEPTIYIQNPSDLIYDTSKKLRVDYDHVIDDNIHRFPVSIQGLPKIQIRNIMEGAISLAKSRVIRNYKTAIPQYFNNEIQLLLPIYMVNYEKADLALAIEIVNEGKDTFYRAATCLTLDMAINNARLIAKPDDEWLKA